MRPLLDTHALLWWLTGDERVSDSAQSAIADDSNDIFVSVASAWEIATKQRIGKLNGVPRVSERSAELVAADGFAHLAIDDRHALLASGDTQDHRDPFDRLLAAQSEIERLPLITRDSAFALFGVQTVW